MDVEPVQAHCSLPGAAREVSENVAAPLPYAKFNCGSFAGNLR